MGLENSEYRNKLLFKVLTKSGADQFSVSLGFVFMLVDPLT